MDPNGRHIAYATSALALAVALVATLASFTVGGSPRSETLAFTRSSTSASTKKAAPTPMVSLRLLDDGGERAQNVIDIDPREEPVPVLELHDSAQSIVLLLELASPTDVELIAAAISPAPPPARAAGPDLISIEALDGAGAIVDSYNDWHPLWVGEHGHGAGDDDEHDHSLAVVEAGIARLILRFDRDIETITLTDTVDEERPVELVEIDVQSIIQGYCAEHADDPACAPGEGCGVGYWRNLVPWSATGYSPFQTVGSIFTHADDELATASLLDALGFRGGKGVLGAQMILLRQAVAALLNSAHPGVDYPLSEADVVAQVGASLIDGRPAMLNLATKLEGLNEGVCPIDASGQAIE